MANNIQCLKEMFQAFVVMETFKNFQILEKKSVRYKSDTQYTIVTKEGNIIERERGEEDGYLVLTI